MIDPTAIRVVAFFASFVAVVIGAWELWGWPAALFAAGAFCWVALLRR